MNEISFPDRWVLLVDIMGFSRMVSDPGDRLRLASTYQEVVQELRKAEFLLRLKTRSAPFPLSTSPTMTDIQEMLDTEEEREREEWNRSIYIFSDTIFAFFEGHRSGQDWGSAPTDPFFLAWTAASLSRLLWMKGLPHRGAITHGPCHIDPKQGIFLGQPIVKAHEWEKCQEWLGISVAPSSIEAARVVLSGSSAPIVDCFVPTKNGGDVRTLVVLPVDEQQSHWDAGFVGAYADAKAQAAGPDVLGKYHSTADLLCCFEGVPEAIVEIAGGRATQRESLSVIPPALFSAKVTVPGLSYTVTVVAPGPQRISEKS